MKNEILEILELLSANDKYKDINKYFTIKNNFFNLYKRQLYAYLRVSTGAQDFSRQIIELYKWLKKKNLSICIDNIYCDKYTGKRLNRKEYNCVRNLLTENDYLILNADDEILMQNKPKTKAQIFFFSTKKCVKGCYIKRNCIYLCICTEWSL